MISRTQHRSGIRWRIVWAIARKDIVDGIKNRYILVSLLMPIVVFILFRLSSEFFSPGGNVLKVLAYDPGASQLVTAVSEIPGFELTRIDSAAQVEAAVQEGTAVGGLVAPPGFDQAVRAGERPELVVYLNPNSGRGDRNEFQRLIEQQVLHLAGQELPAQIAWSGSPASQPAAQLVALSANHFLLALMLLLALTTGGVVVVPLLLVEEKERHTLQMLRVSPARPLEIALGKAITGMLYTTLTIGVILFFSGVVVGDWLVVTLALLLGALLVVALGLWLGSVLNTVMQVNTWGTVLLFILIAPAFIGAFSVSSSVESVMQFLPTYHLLVALSRALEGATPIAQVAVNLLVMLGFIVASFAGMVWTLRRQTR